MKPSEITMSPELEDGWSAADQANADFLDMKYADREKLGEEWIQKHKAAEAAKTREDGKANPHYPRLAMEATLARMAFDMSYVITQNLRIRREMDILTELYQRVGILEGAYSYLRSSTDHIKKQYRESMLKSLDERREFSTVLGMQNAGLNPDSKEDRLKWAYKLDQLATAAFAQHDANIKKT